MGQSILNQCIKSKLSIVRYKLLVFYTFVDDQRMNGSNQLQNFWNEKPFAIIILIP